MPIVATDITTKEISEISAKRIALSAHRCTTSYRCELIAVKVGECLVHWRIQTIQLGSDLVGGLGPDEGRGIVVVLVDVAVDGRLQLDDRAEDAPPEPPPGQPREGGLHRTNAGP